VGANRENLERLGLVTSLRAVRCAPVSLELLRVLGRLPALRAACLFRVNWRGLDPSLVVECHSLEHLMISGTLRLDDLSWLRKLPALRTLYHSDIKSVALETLPRLPRLRGFQLQGGMNAALKVGSLAPLARLRGLRYLSLGVQPAERSLKPLRVMRELRDLNVPAGMYPLEKYARLVAAMS
jgi:hypothetical protein